MDMNTWLTLHVERDEHLINAQMALHALESNCELPPRRTGIVRRHLNRIYKREVALAELALIILNSQNQPSTWNE